MAGEKSATGAVCWTVGSCYALWAVFWLQFVVGFVVGLPLLPNRLPERGLEYLSAKPDLFGLSLPETWLVLSVVLSVWALAGVLMVSRGKKGRWRMRLVTVAFSLIAVGFAVGMLSSRAHYLKRTRQVMWLQRFYLDQLFEWDGDVARQLAAYHHHRDKLVELEQVIVREEEIAGRTPEEAQQVLTAACSEFESRAISALGGKTEDLRLERWEDAWRDSEYGEWVLQTQIGTIGYLEARLPDWATEPRVTVVATREGRGEAEVLRWGR